MIEPKPTAAVVGSGVSGLTAAHLLSRTHRVTLWEADSRLGGHAHTHEVTSGEQTHRIDSGFIVHNNTTYPQLTRLFRELGVETQATEMSMSTSCEGCGLEWAGGRGASGVFAQRRRAADPRYLRMLTEIPRFHRRAQKLLEGTEDLTWGQFLSAGRFSDYFVRHFALPLVACVWSSPAQDARDYPARHLFTFLQHHGMLSISGSPAWRTVVGGSGTYVDALTQRLDEVRVGVPVRSIHRHEDSVQIKDDDGVTHDYDRLVLATHADDALQILGDAIAEETVALEAFGYSANEAVLHRDRSVLPSAVGARSSWNYRLSSCTTEDAPVMVSYWMNRLQHIKDADDFLVTLNPGSSIPEHDVIARMNYRHPIFTPAAVSSAKEIIPAGGPRLAFAGAHLGWGFHEDGCRSGVQAAERLGGTW